MAYTAQSFLEKLKPYVIKDMQTSGILCSLTASQAFIESNKGNSGLTTKCNNLFGIKGKYNGQSGKFMTTEYYNGVKTRVQADFRKYPSWLESINDHSALFNTKDRYKNLRNCQDYKEACTNVKNDGYATSPTYTSTLMNTVKKYKLWMWDYEVLKGFKTSRLKTVKSGAVGGGAYLLQELLKKAGFDPGTLDGVFGKKSVGALIAYQTSKKLTPDGICGQKTWAAIKG